LGTLLNGKVALITGAGQGIGRSIALAFAREGARIAVTGRTKRKCDSVVAEIVKGGGKAQTYSLDVTNDGDVDDAVEKILTTWKQIDILVNNAGILLNKSPTWSTTIAEWDTIMQVNLRGVFLCSHAVIPHMIERKSGAIINIGSSSGRMADDEYGPYAASKWGVVGYTMSLARSLRTFGIQVNGINPGWVDTDMTRTIDPKGNPEWSSPDEISRVAIFLAAQAPRDMTGQFVDVFGS